MPYLTRKRIYRLDGPEYITAYAARSTQVLAVVERLQHALGGNRDIHADDSTVDQINTLSGVQRNVQAGLAGALATAVLVIVFSVILLVRERTREIGVLKALGASTMQVIGQFAVEVLTLSVSAAALSTLLLVAAGPTVAAAFGASGSSAGTNTLPPGLSGVAVVGPGGQQLGASATNGLTTGLSAGLTPDVLLALCALAVGLAILASAIPAWYVARLRPAQALRQP
jgi:putative ABC transport system permease protein